MPSIPKKIHYCWFGGNSLPEQARKCIQSWGKYCPDYEIKEWNESNFDIHICKYVEEAYAAKKWAFVSDYARFKALYQDGGVYLDIDIEVLKSFDDLLSNSVFLGFGRESLTLPVFGASKNHPFLKAVIEDYNNRHFTMSDGTYDTTTVERTAEKILVRDFNLKMNGEKQTLADGIVIYPRTYFSSTDWQTGIITRNPNLYVIHYANGSWMTKDQKIEYCIKRKLIFILGQRLGTLVGTGIVVLKRDGIKALYSHLHCFLRRHYATSFMKACGKLKTCPKKIVFENFCGKGYGDNPKYIAEELLRRKQGYDLVWIVNAGSNYSFPEGIRKVRRGSFRELYELATAKFWIDNNHKESFIYKRQDQIYIQTWHGFYPFKKIEKDAENSLSKGYIQEAIHDASMTDLMVSGCKARTNLYKSSFWYNGKIAECGMPRNDIFFHDNQYRKKVCSILEIPESKKLVLYAPTLRDDHSITAYNLDYEQLCDTLEASFGAEWICLIRLHPALRDNTNFVISSKKCKNVSDYDDIQELFVASDLLITDYSDCMFEYSLTRKPIFIYASDLDRYINDRGFYYDIHELPYPIATNNDEMMQNIWTFDEAAYYSRIDKFLNKIGSFENGTASSFIANYIQNNTRGK